MINKSRADNAVASINDSFGFTVRDVRLDCDDTVTCYSNIGDKLRTPRAIDDRSPT
jgi:hypothetical protein